jgi:hypothetical protein
MGSFCCCNREKVVHYILDGNVNIFINKPEKRTQSLSMQASTDSEILLLLQGLQASRENIFTEQSPEYSQRIDPNSSLS